jgi:hypothetical protein
LGIESAEHGLAGLDAAGDALLIGVERLVQYLAGVVFGGFDGFELLLEHTERGGLARDVFIA